MTSVKSVEEQFALEMGKADATSSAVVAINVLINYLSEMKKSVTTVAEVLQLLKTAIQKMMKTDVADAALESSCEIFNWYITRFTADPSFETRSLNDIMEEILKYGRQYLQALQVSRAKLASYGKGLLKDNGTILTYCKSRCVLEVMKSATSSPMSKRFSVLIVQSLSDPEAAGEMKSQMNQIGLNSRIIPESAVGFEMEKVDAVCVGAEAVCLSGGVVNRLGTLTIALCAQAMNKPFYVFAESHKFNKALFPLSNSDIHAKWLQYNSSCNRKNEMQFSQTDQLYPVVDYTEPNLITYVVSDLGILTPAIVCEQLLRLYE